MDLIIYVILGIIFGGIFSKKYKMAGGLYIYIIIGMIGAFAGGLFSSAFITKDIFINIFLSIIFSLILLYVFKILVNKTS